MRNRIERFLRDESGMEMVEWTIVATVFAVAAASFWSVLGGAIKEALDAVVAEISAGTPAPGGTDPGNGTS